MDETGTGGWRVEGVKIKAGGRVGEKKETSGGGGPRASRAGNGEREARRNACYCPTLGVRLVVDRSTFLKSN